MARVNINMQPYQYMNYHHKDTTMGTLMRGPYIATGSRPSSPNTSLPLMDSFHDTPFVYQTRTSTAMNICIHRF